MFFMSGNNRVMPENNKPSDIKIPETKRQIASTENCISIKIKLQDCWTQTDCDFLQKQVELLCKID